MSKKLVIEKRDHVSGLWKLLSFLIAVTAAFIVTAILLAVTGQNVGEAYVALFEGAFGGAEQIMETFVRATPLILLGMATVVAFRAKIWSIGQEGQLLLGSIWAYLASVLFSGLPMVIMLPLVLLFAFFGGGVLGALCGWLKSRFGVDEIISTVMLNYVAFYLLTYLLSGPLMEAGSFYMQTARIDEAALLPLMVEDTRFHGGFILAILATVVIGFIMSKTPLGYDIKAFGFNANAMTFKGTNVPKMFVLTMFISGGLAGLAGASETLGVHGRLNADIASGLGFTGITVALVGGLSPLGTFLAAILFGGLVSGGFMMQVLTGVPVSIVYVMQAVVLLFFLCSALLARFQIKFVETDKGPATSQLEGVKADV